MRPLSRFIIALSLAQCAVAQNDIPLLIPEERSAVEAQAAEFNDAITPSLAAAAKSTVRVWAGSRRLSYGTIVGDGSQILSKWSEVSRARVDLRVDAGGEYRAVTLAGVYPEEDLALLKVDGPPLTPVTWSFVPPKLGAFLAAPQPDGRLAAFGVVSVLERNLRDTDMAYLGVYGDEDYRGVGVKIKDIEEKSGANDAGLEKGNIILKVGDRSISGLMELKNSLAGITPGTRVTMRVERGGRQENVEVLLGNRPPDLTQFPGDRLQVMERMGGPISEVRDSFTRVIQTDMRPKPNQVGGPVVDLRGNVLGITVARADRTRSFIMPAAAVVELLKSEARTPEFVLAKEKEALAQAEAQAAEPHFRGGFRMPPSGTPQPRMVPPSGMPRPRTEDQMRRHLTDMQRLMDHMRQEMDALEQP